MSERISKELAKYIIDRDIRLAIEQAYSEKPNKKINCELALDIAIESLEQENLDISIDWLDEFISWAKHRVKTAYENYSDRIDIKINKNELSRIIKILEHYYKKVEPYERKE